MPQFKITLRNKITAEMSSEEITAENEREARLDVTSNDVQVVTVRRLDVQPTASAYVPMRELKNQVAWKATLEQEQEAKMLGEDFDRRTAFLNARKALG